MKAQKIERVKLVFKYKDITLSRKLVHIESIHSIEKKKKKPCREFMQKDENGEANMRESEVEGSICCVDFHFQERWDGCNSSSRIFPQLRFACIQKLSLHQTIINATSV